MDLIDRLVHCVRETSLVEIHWGVRVQAKTAGLRTLRKPNDANDVVAFARERLGFSPDAQQEMVLRGGRRIDIGLGFNGGALEQLVRVLEGV